MGRSSEWQGACSSIEVTANSPPGHLIHVRVRVLNRPVRTRMPGGAWRAD